MHRKNIGKKYIKILTVVISGCELQVNFVFFFMIFCIFQIFCEHMLLL